MGSVVEHIPLSRMQTMQKNIMRAMDPELLKHVTPDNHDDDIKMEVIPIMNNLNKITSASTPSAESFEDNIINSDFEENIDSPKSSPTEWERHMNKLKNYVDQQTKLYESHPMSKDKPLQLINDHRTDISFTEYT